MRSTTGDYQLSWWWLRPRLVQRHVSLLPPMQKQGVAGEVASPGLEGGQVAVLRPRAASIGHVTKAAYSSSNGMYVRHGTKHVRAPRKRRTSENSVKAKFAQYPYHVLRCI